MTRPAAVSKEQVFEAAQRLQDRGDKVTPVSVRREVGGVGSYSTLGDYLKEWRAQQHRHEAAEIPEIPTPVAASFKRIWAEAWTASQAMLTAERQAHQSLQTEMENSAREMKTEIHRLEQLAEDHRRRLTDAQTQSQQLDIEKARLEERLHALQTTQDTTAAALTISQVEREALNAEVIRLQTLLKSGESTALES